MRNLTNYFSLRSGGKKLSLGELISATYGARGSKATPQMVQFALDAHLVRFERASDLRSHRL